ncbi:MAG: 23S rRNA (adenine(2503)-C(2))-methyltransferase RlmN [Bacilli bacterium]|nr:23S rRNA (adenine(2503)-C(2))-methyltransferase RlmN [Bacilli bacterium]
MHILDIPREKLEEYFIGIGEKKFKALQVFEWLYEKKEWSSDNFSNLKKEVRDKLKDDFVFSKIEIVKKEEDELTKKYLFKLEDNNHVEAVLMYHDYGRSVCISSQVGCNMGCKFCESGRLKKVRNLNTFEMVLQIMMIEEDIKERISSVVIMGIGEPLDNYDNVINFIKIINDAKGLAIGARHITLSTCGLVPKIYELANLPLQINLAISLHAPNDEIRNQVMPVNKVYNISQLMTAISDYIAQTNRRVTIEYVMLKEVNDSKEHATMLANLLRGLNVYVNLIPYNETNNIVFKKSDKSTILAFYDELKKQKINVTIRKEFGSKISAACGQLRSKEVKR